VFALISVFSYGFLAYNIQNQGIGIDEVFHHGFSMTYFDLIMEGELSDPCITDQGECSKIDLTCAGEIQWVESGECMRQAINMKESLNNPIVLFSGIAFLVIILIIYINKNKKLTIDKPKKI